MQRIPSSKLADTLSRNESGYKLQFEDLSLEWQGALPRPPHLPWQSQAASAFTAMLQSQPSLLQQLNNLPGDSRGADSFRVPARSWPLGGLCTAYLLSSMASAYRANPLLHQKDPLFKKMYIVAEKTCQLPVVNLLINESFTYKCERMTKDYSILKRKRKLTATR